MTAGRRRWPLPAAAVAHLRAVARDADPDTRALLAAGLDAAGVRMLSVAAVLGVSEPTAARRAQLGRAVALRTAGQPSEQLDPAVQLHRADRVALETVRGLLQGQKIEPATGSKLEPVDTVRRHGDEEE